MRNGNDFTHEYRNKGKRKLLVVSVFRASHFLVLRSEHSTHSRTETYHGSKVRRGLDEAMELDASLMSVEVLVFSILSSLQARLGRKEQ